MSARTIIIDNRFRFDVEVEGVIPIIIGNITQDYVDWAEKRSCYLSTMPRSGTNFITYFFNYFHMALSGTLDFKHPIPEEVVKGGWTASMEKSLNFKWFLVSHNYCPGFESLCSGEFRKKWNNIIKDKLEDNNDTNYIFLIEKFRNVLYPNLNKNTKIIFLYRNPLDQIISLSKHFKNHISPLANSGLDNNESIILLINQYLKMYLTYDYMKKQYPDNIKMVSYEKLVKDPKDMIKDILEYYNFDLTIDNRMELFEKTLELVTPKALRELELRMGKTLAGDQKVSSAKESHMRGGKTGNWKEFFSEDELYLIEKRFNEFNLTLNQFEGIEYEFSQDKLNSIDINKIILNETKEFEDTLKTEYDIFPSQPILLIENYHNLAINIVQYKDKYYAVPQRLGPVDLVSNKNLDNSILIETSLEKLKQRLLK